MARDAAMRYPILAPLYLLGSLGNSRGCPANLVHNARIFEDLGQIHAMLAGERFSDSLMAKICTSLVI